MSPSAWSFLLSALLHLGVCLLFLEGPKSRAPVAQLPAGAVRVELITEQRRHPATPSLRSPVSRTRSTSTPSVRQGYPEGNRESALEPLAGRELLVYPAEALKRRWQGTVVLDFEIDESGNVVQAFVVESSGFWVLDRAAQQNLLQWKFAPGKKGVFRKPFIFRLQSALSEK